MPYLCGLLRVLYVCFIYSTIPIMRIIRIVDIITRQFVPNSRKNAQKKYICIPIA